MPPRKRLNKVAVITTAAELVNAEGSKTLTLGRLAKGLGVKTPSLYNHIAGLPGLQRELSLWSVRLLGDCLGKAALGKSGAEAVRAAAQAYREFIKENPGVYLLSLQSSGSQVITDKRPVDEELRAAEDRVVEISLAVLSSFGLKREDGLHAVRGMRSLVHGFATLEIAGGFGLPLDCDESFRRLVELFIRGLERQNL